MNQFFENAIKNWKSSVQGILTVTIALGTYLTVTPSTVISPHAAGIITLVTGAAKVLIALTEKD